MQEEVLGLRQLKGTESLVQLRLTPQQSSKANFTTRILIELVLVIITFQKQIKSNKSKRFLCAYAFFCETPNIF